MGKTTGFLEYDRVNGPVREETEWAVELNKKYDSI